QAADASLANARRAHDALERKVQSGLRASNDVATLATATSSLASAKASVQSVLDGMWNRTTSALTSSQKQTILTIRGNSSHHLPVEYLVENRPPAQWLALRNATAAVRIAGQGTPPAGAQELITTTRASSGVAAAITALGGTTEVRAAWQTASAPATTTS